MLHACETPMPDPVCSIFRELRILQTVLVLSPHVRPLVPSIRHKLTRHRCQKISQVSTSTTLLGMPSSLPIYVSPAALARLGHPDGEMNLVRAAGAAGILQGVRTSPSRSPCPR